MNKAIIVLSKIPNLLQELKIVAPNLIFKDEVNADVLNKSEIIIADFDLLIPEINNLKEVKWVQSTWAGVDKFLPYFDEDKFKDTIITRFSGKHFGRLMSEYVVANIINYERNFFAIYENKKQKLWKQEGKIFQHRSISELTIGVLGVGNIGNYIAGVLKTFGAKVWGFGRRENLPNTEQYQHYEKYCTQKNLPLLLNNCDYIVNVLPSTKETTGLLNGNILENCSNKSTVFINIGRGNIIKEEDLIRALKEKWLTAAILDVFQEEPLTSKSELWNLDQVFITPHVAGVSRGKDIAEQFLDNYNLYQDNKPIPTRLFVNNQY